MKKIISIVTIAIVVVSCGGGSDASVADAIASSDIETIRAKRIEITNQQKNLEKEVRLLDSVIMVLDDNAKLPLVTTYQASVKKFDHYLELQGDVMTKQNVLVYPEMAGTLNRVYVKEGQKVSKGKILASIDDGGLSSSLAQMRTQAELAKTTFERQKRLWEQNIGSEIQYLQAKTQYEAQTSAVKQMESQVGKSTIRAPFSGIVDNVIKDQGTVVSPGPGSEIFRIVNLSDMYVEVEVPESYLNGIKKGKKAKVYFPVLGDTIVSAVRQTGNFINPNNRAFTIEVPVPNKSGSIKPNLTAKVSLNDYTNEEAILIPQGIISENSGGEQYLYVATKDGDDGVATVKRQIITTGLTQGRMVEVLSGVNSGDLLIDEGARTVKDGQNVKILNLGTDE
ncbi:efflux RND transporter periplasmic adaptor subunit [Croceitalea vernalis]|uniref:Efflux RND transporter periplasmic adaptor subunit n=1 Tax=Croceitalea vernalis TaxID=3075599 RepID=A0ABU3BEY1_9FLAO|nr:efflux RND transporter periplasmic adaptor subunit [Croceitalea sp. P007]MDT0620714.1 efflux RND transporter periplasmic adaptor subunit [Croceitalea sp. P007]